ncbi:hypothetical protein TWF718_003317 [Orbilia javanica]|uniref:Uncharacterized protein n=1 Tax=Orbilia javanica TaxID=47235 RepID=A0AAN8MP45_9PEZI
MSDEPFEWHLQSRDFTTEEKDIVDNLNKLPKENAEVIKRLHLLREAEKLKKEQDRLIDEYEEDIAELEGRNNALRGRIVAQIQQIRSLQATTNHADPVELARLRVELQRAYGIIDGILKGYESKKRVRPKKWEKREDGSLVIPEDYLPSEQPGGAQDPPEAGPSGSV